MHDMPLRFTLALASAHDPPTGVLIGHAGAEHRFDGWMQLSSALAAAMAAAAADEKFPHAASPPGS